MNYALDRIADDIFSESQLNIVKNDTSDEGTLLKSGNINRKFLEKEIVYSVPYASSIEWGADAHEIPIIEIQNPRGITKQRKTNIKVPILYGWTQRKLGKGPVDAIAVSWAIKQKIAREGSPAQPFLRSALEKILAKRRLE